MHNLRVFEEVKNLVLEAFRNASFWAIMANFHCPDTKAQTSGIQLGVIREGFLHKMYIPATEAGITFDQVTHKLQNKTQHF